MSPSYNGLDTVSTVYYIGTVNNLRCANLTDTNKVSDLIKDNVECKNALEKILYNDFKCIPIYLDPHLEEDYYYGYCKQVLYPILHNILTVYDTVSLDGKSNDFHETESILYLIIIIYLLILYSLLVYIYFILFTCVIYINIHILFIL